MSAAGRLRRWAALALCGAPLGLAACSGPSALPEPATAAPSTSTTVPPAQLAALQPLLLTTADFPTGWTQDTQANAAGTKGTPACVADLVVERGSASRTDAVFVGPGKQPAAVIQTVGAFEPGTAPRSVGALRTTFDSCNGLVLDPGGTRARVAIRSLADPAGTGDGFAAQMTLAEGGRSSYLDVFYGVRGDDATFLGWSSSSPATGPFLALSAAALAKL